MHVERTLTIPRPIEAVFDYLGDFTHTEAWDPGTVSTTRVSGDGGVGTTYANTSEFMGRQTSLEYRTVVFDRPGKLQFRGRNKTAQATDTMTFTEVGAGTQLHYHAEFDFGRLLNLVAPLFLGRKLEKLADDTVAQLEKTLLNHT